MNSLNKIKLNKKLKISILSEKQIENLSFGEVKNSKTLNYNSLKPIKDGLFCSRIFGNLKSENCYCNKFSKENICDICGYEPNSSEFRRTRMGHIKLNWVFINKFFLNKNPRYLSLILNISLKNLNNIIYKNYYIVLYSNYKKFKFGKIFNYNDYIKNKIKYSDKFYAETGYFALKKFLSLFNLKNEFLILKKKIKSNKSLSYVSYLKLLKRYKIYKKLCNLKINLNKLIFNKILVLPPDLRPIVKLNDNTVVSSDINEHYRLIINRNNRLKKILKYNFPLNLVKENCDLIQDSIDDLYGVKTKLNINKSISDNIKGKLGIFRQNLLGKRVDYSGRAVIVSGPFLKLNECSIPYLMAIELFKPFIYNFLIYKKNFSIERCNKYLNLKKDLIFFALRKIIKNKFVLLNRAPTLHRLGIQSFKPLLNNDNVIKLHPLVCSSFNADFDGDQMAVHLPITTNSNVECKLILSIINNVLSSSNGECAITPTQDIVLGIYYSTKIFNNSNFYYFSNIKEIFDSYNSNKIGLNSRIFYRIKFFHENCFYYNLYETTMMRVFLYNFLPKSFSFYNFNKNFDKKDISKFLIELFENYGSYSVVSFCEILMRFGFFSSTRSGISISIDDMSSNYDKKALLDKSFDLYNYYNILYLNGMFSNNNRYRKIINIWETLCNYISNLSITNLFYFNEKKFNSLYYIINSGSRGSEMQINQICGIRGLIFYKNFGLLEIPVFSSLKDGLNPLEFFYFTCNSRKTLSDTALKTSSSGYLTRKLVEVCNNVYVNEIDCFSKSGILLKDLVNNGEVIEKLFNRVLGRFISEDVYDRNNNIILFKNTLISKIHLKIFENFDIFSLKIRSPITCLSKEGVCSYCYGLDLSKNSLVNVGELVGVIAAQSIGEPGTQLTMRTFHSGGAYISKSIISNYYSNNYGFVKFSNSLKFVLNKDNSKLVISNNGKIKIMNKFNEEISIFKIPYGSILNVDNNNFLKIGDLICSWDPYYYSYISEFSGKIFLKNFLENINFIKRYNNVSGFFYYEILRNNFCKPYIELFYDDLSNVILNLDFEYCVFFNNEDFFKSGDIIFKYPLNINNYSDIIGGLPKINDLFEAKIPKNFAILSIIEGFVNIKKNKNNFVLTITNFSGNKIIHKIPFIKQILVKNNDYINKGDFITNGSINPHDILKLYSIDGLNDYFLSEIKNIYHSQSININDKHIEIIIKQMLKKVIIKENFKNFLQGDIVNINELNKFLKFNIYKNLFYKYLLSGITKSSLNSEYFLSSASFQETTTSLINSSLFNRSNKLSSIKDNVMLGDVIPAGTGYYSNFFN